MQRHQSLQSYVPPLIADWIRKQARLKQVSVSIVVRYHRRLERLGLIPASGKGRDDEA